ncbi:MAG: aspartate aminotransferase family protein [Pirellulales bacterium]
MATSSTKRTENANPPAAVQHQGEDRSNAIRARMAAVEPRGLRTYTPSLAVIARSEGCYHYTPEGRKLADFTSGVLVANLGHNPPAWWRRILELMQLDRAADAGSVPLTTYNAVTELEVLASERLVASLRAQPGGGRMEHVLWAASGSEAIQKSLWAAMAHRPGADVILATRAGFHGKKGLAGAVTGSERDHERDPRVRFISFPCDECRSVERRRLPLDLAPYEKELAAALKEHGDRLCAVITEPYLGGGGSYHPQPEYLQLLQRFCREHDLVFILDEIQSNFGRTGSMYAFTTYGIEPDIAVLGKGMANGIPVDAAVGRADVLGTLNYGEGSDTWSGHPLGCAAVLATLEAFEQQDVLGHAATLSEVIERHLLRMTKLPAIAAVRGEGTVWGIECAPLGSQAAGDVANRIVEDCYRGDASGRAVHLLGPLAGKVLRVAPPLVMPLDEAEEYLSAMLDIIAHLN